jgi:hypothetical protein
VPAPWRRNLTFAAVAGLYLLLLAAVVGGALYARSWAISVYGSPQAQSQWDEWRAGAAKLATEGPVKRRVPKSDKPPALVLATTYFGICLSIALVLSTVLFATGVYLIQGVLRSRLGDITSPDHMVHRQRRD